MNSPVGKYVYFFKDLPKWNMNVGGCVRTEDVVLPVFRELCVDNFCEKLLTCKLSTLNLFEIVF